MLLRGLAASDERARVQLWKHWRPNAEQRSEYGRMVRLDLLITPETMRRLCDIVDVGNRENERRLTRAEVGRHLLTRAVMEVTRATRRRSGR